MTRAGNVLVVALIASLVWPVATWAEIPIALNTFINFEETGTLPDYLTLDWEPVVRRQLVFPFSDN